MKVQPNKKPSKKLIAGLSALMFVGMFCFGALFPANEGIYIQKAGAAKDMEQERDNMSEEIELTIYDNVPLIVFFVMIGIALAALGINLQSRMNG